MKTLWNAVSFLFVVNGLAAALFVGWLVMTDRLDMDRVYEIRDILATTIRKEALENARRAEAEAAHAAAALERARRENPLPPSMHQISYSDQIEQIQRDRLRRADDDLARLRREIQLEQAELARERAAFEAERGAWHEVRDAIAAQVGDAQFQQVVSLLEGLPAKQAKEMFLNMIEAGAMDRAVSFLSAMKSYAAAKVLREFKSEAEQEVATELLQRLTTLGTGPGGGEPLSHADSSPSDSGS